MRQSRDPNLAQPQVRYRYLTCDVFTGRRFGGNPLAVLPDAEGLTGTQMQQITREFNYSESTFVFPPETGGTRKVRIFTPRNEIPFAGHPNVGTAFVLASIGEFGLLKESTSVRFEEIAGAVPITIAAIDGRPIRCDLSAPEALSLGKNVPVEVIAAALSLSPNDIVSETHLPRRASVGLPFLFVELRDVAALGRVKVSLSDLYRLHEYDAPLDIAAYVHTTEEFDLRVRVFIPMDGVLEDPATGSANCALAAMLAQFAPQRSGEFHWRIAQGVEMGRPSVLEASADKQDGKVVTARIGGECVLVTEGLINVG